MNTLSNTYVVEKVNDEDIKILSSNIKDINNGVEQILQLMKMNKMPLIDKLVRLVDKKKIRLINDERLEHATVRWLYSPKSDSVLVNVSPSTTKKRGLDNTYNIPSNELYSYLIGAAVFYYSNKLNRDRTYLKDCLNVYVEMIAKIFIKATQGHFKNTTDTSIFHFLMIKYLLSHNNTAISNIDGFGANFCSLSEADINVLNSKYKIGDFSDLETFITNVLSKEFVFMEGISANSIIHATSVMIGVNNTYALESIETIGTIITDHIIGNRPSLYGRYGTIKGLVKSNMYQNILEILKSV